MGTRKYVDFCNNCSKIIKQTEISDGVFGCEYCKKDTNIEIIDVTDYVYDGEDDEDEE